MIAPTRYLGEAYRAKVVAVGLLLIFGAQLAAAVPALRAELVQLAVGVTGSGVGAHGNRARARSV